MLLVLNARNLSVTMKKFANLGSIKFYLCKGKCSIDFLKNSLSFEGTSWLGTLLFRCLHGIGNEFPTQHC